MKAIRNLLEMQTGRDGVVTRIEGGLGMARRLDALEIRPGARLTKTSAACLRGPVTVRIGNAQIAIGFGMAGRIQVEIDEDEPR